MPRYKKKPVTIEAVQYEGRGNFKDAEVPDWIWEALENGDLAATAGTDPFMIKTTEGKLRVAPGDFIIRGVQGELYPCKPDIFEATYDLVDD